MADTPPALTPDEASALEAIGGKPADTPAADPPPAEFVAEAAPQPIHTDEEPVHEHGNEGGALHTGDADTHHAHGAHDAHEDHAHQAPAEDSEMAEMKSTMLDSAQLANRAAGMAAKSAGDMHKATTELIESAGGQKIYLVIVLAVFGLLIVLAISIFAFMSFRLQQRVTQADAMLLAVGKRVIAMDESLEMFSGHGEALREVASKQDAIMSAQTKNELRMDEVMRAVQTAADSIAKPANGSDKDKAPDVAKLLKEMDGKLQAQASAINNLSSQIRSIGSPAPARVDPAAVRKEAEALVRQLKAAEASVKPPTPAPAPAPAPAAPAVAPKPAEKPVEKLVQYPRIQGSGKTTDGQ